MMQFYVALLNREDGQVERRYALDVGQRLSVGRRPDADIFIPLYNVNRQHCEVGRDEIGAWVRDLNSRNRVYVNNGAAIEPDGVHRLCLDDVLRVCDARLRLTATVPVDPLWLTWSDGTVPKIAESISRDRAFDRLPILADALEEAGCDNADILAHCRGPNPHAQGCWAVDLLLNKE